LKITGIVVFSGMSLALNSCKKEITETKELNNSSPNANYSSDIIGSQLSTFWTNYSAHRNLPLVDGSSPNLDATLNETEMLSTLHYGLNVALTEVDTTFEIVTTAEFTNSIPMTSDGRLSNKNACIFFDKTLQSIKKHTTSTEITERKIHEINLDVTSYSDSSAIIKATVKFSSGEFYATSDLEWTSGSSPYLAKFTPSYKIPWVAKSTPEQGKQATGHGKYNYFGYILKDNWSVTPSVIGEIQAKLTADKAAHDILSNNALCWTDPSIAPSTIAIPTNSKIVPSDKNIGTIETVVKLINKENSQQTPNENITPLDVAVYCGNPSTPNLGQGDEGPNDIQPSALLSYYNNEKSFGLTDFREVNGAQMNFFWKNRNRIIAVAFNKKKNALNSKLTSLKFGFYAINEIKYVAQAWQSRGESDGSCYSFPCFTPNVGTLMWTICKWQCNYRPDITFKHYSWQPLPPAQLRNLQNSVL
jgi:hypothetical protein